MIVNGNRPVSAPAMLVREFAPNQHRDIANAGATGRAPAIWRRNEPFLLAPFLKPFVAKPFRAQSTRSIAGRPSQIADCNGEKNGSEER